MGTNRINQQLIKIKDKYYYSATANYSYKVTQSSWKPAQEAIDDIGKKIIPVRAFIVRQPSLDCGRFFDIVAHYLGQIKEKSLGKPDLLQTDSNLLFIFY